MTQSLTQQESAAISYLRVAAMTSIVVCHFMQALDNHWAWVFNIGVQVFLLMSGFLYGHKHITGWWQWYRRRFIRIYVPFILFFITIVPLYAVSGQIKAINIFSYIANIQWFMGCG